MNIIIEHVKSFDFFDVELIATYDVYTEEYGADIDGNRGKLITCADLNGLKSKVKITDEIGILHSEDMLSLDEIKQEMIDECEEKAKDRYNEEAGL